MPQKVRRAKLKTNNHALNLKIEEIKSDFNAGVRAGGKIRHYTLPGQNSSIIHIITPNGSQRLFKAVERGGKIELEHTGYADTVFNHREVFGGMKRRGLGKKMLSVFEANLRAQGINTAFLWSSVKSTAAFLIKNGYTPRPAINQEKFKSAGLKNTSELQQYLKNKETSEELPFALLFTKTLRGKK